MNIEATEIYNRYKDIISLDSVEENFPGFNTGLLYFLKKLELFLLIEGGSIPAADEDYAVKKARVDGKLEIINYFMQLDMAIKEDKTPEAQVIDDLISEGLLPPEEYKQQELGIDNDPFA